jgi:hypothetical protein
MVLLSFNAHVYAIKISIKILGHIRTRYAYRTYMIYFFMRIGRVLCLSYSVSCVPDVSSVSRLSNVLSRGKTKKAQPTI